MRQVYLDEDGAVQFLTPAITSRCPRCGQPEAEHVQKWPTHCELRPIAARQALWAARP